MTGTPIRLAVVGIGKIARDQHLRAILQNPDFELAATADPKEPGVDGVPHFGSLDAILKEGPAIDAVAVCTPPQYRHTIAAQALEQKLHVLLEKPPAATMAEAEHLSTLARTAGSVLFAAWHSRFAGGVAPAKAWLAERRIESVSIVWREDVRKWHPGQAWIWEPGGLGVFDPGINALSIATLILPNVARIEAATLVTPINRAAPIAATLNLRDTTGTPIDMDLDWRQTGLQTWQITVETDAGQLALSGGGSSLQLPGEAHTFEDNEYPALYGHFAQLIRRGESDADFAPFRLVADAFLLARREPTEAFYD